jgi:hypothetical protein
MSPDSENAKDGAAEATTVVPATMADANVSTSFLKILL